MPPRHAEQQLAEELGWRIPTRTELRACAWDSIRAGYSAGWLSVLAALDGEESGDDRAAIAVDDYLAHFVVKGQVRITSRGRIARGEDR